MKHPKVLLIDDEDDICSIVQISLQCLAGWELLIEHSGEEALARAVQDRPDVILLDVMLPGIDGLSTFERLRNHPATELIPVIFMTAKVQKHELARYVDLGATGVITKPFDPMTLHEQIAVRLGSRV